MNISLTTITRYAGTGGILLNAQQTGLESAGFFHRLKSFFNFGDARAKNRATLDAIRTAVLSDPRFAPADLQAQARHLLDGVRTDRAIDASRIRGIVTTLEDSAHKILKAQVELHLAGNLPPEYAEYASEVGDLATQRAERLVASGNPVNIAVVVGKAIDTLKGAIKFYAHANEVATGRIAEGARIASCGYVSATLEFMDTVGRPLTKEHVEPIDDYVTSMSDLTVRMFGPNPTGKQVRSLVDVIGRQMGNRPIATQYGKPIFGRDDKANLALARYVGQRMSLNLPEAMREAICTNLHIQSASELFEKLAYVSIFRKARI